MRISPKAAGLLLASGIGFAAQAQQQEPEAQRLAPIELGAPFADNAILQRQMKVPVWGWSKSGSLITVEFAGQKKSATAGDDGKWMLRLDPLPANASPASMLISDSAGAKVRLENILVGEVWLASGQSNMQWIARKSSCSLIIKALAKNGDVPPIREAKVTNFFSALHPIEHAKVAWTDGTSLGDHSAIAFAFAHRLYQELGVPIGILNCSFSQTSIEAWVPRGGFAAGTDDHSRSVHQKILETDPTTPEHRAAWNAFYQQVEAAIAENAALVARGESAKPIPKRTPGNMAGNRDASWLFNARLNPMIPYAIRGGIWNQGYANMGAGLKYYANLHSMIRGWRELWQRSELPVYFHQFYSPGKGADLISIGSTAEMRLATWLARDIPHANMASQIDVTGAIHYRSKAVPGQRLALHALKNQYGKKIVAEGPMFKSYRVEGEKLIVAFDFAEGGLVVAETRTNATGKGKRGTTGFADPKAIENGDDQVTLFFLADEHRVWHRASMRVDGDEVVLTAKGVKSPRGVSYGTSAMGFAPNVYNRALLPMTPFIFYDHKLVTSETWPDSPIKIAGVELDPSAGGRRYEYRKMPVLSTQFRDYGVIQAGTPVTFWGAAIHPHGYEAKGEAVIKFHFAGIEKTIPVTPGMRYWEHTVPAMPASAEPKTLRVAFMIDGEVIHERVAENMVVGDVWYVSAPSPEKRRRGKKAAATGASTGVVRVMKRKAKRSTYPKPHRLSVATSSTPKNRFASVWADAGGGFAAALGQRIAAKTGKPVGIVYMESHDPALKSWIGLDYLKQAPSLMADYEDLAKIYPGNSLYDANARRYVGEWKAYWNGFVRDMMTSKRVPGGAPWGRYPSLSASSTSKASQTYNGLVCTFAPGSFKGIVFMCSETMFAADHGANYGSELAALANCWKDGFAGEDPHFFYTIPSKALAPKITGSTSIKGKSTAHEIHVWSGGEQASALIDTIMTKAY